MLRTTTWTLVCASLALSFVFVTGCVGETDEPASNVWYDDESAKCYTEDEDGAVVEVRCVESPSFESLGYVPPDGCPTPNDCSSPPDITPK